MTTIAVVLYYKDLNGIPIPIPEGYPESMDFQGLSSVRDVTSELILEMVAVYLEEFEVCMRTDIVIFWSAMDTNPSPRGKLN